jgi:hypothetical protein
MVRGRLAGVTGSVSRSGRFRCHVKTVARGAARMKLCTTMILDLLPRAATQLFALDRVQSGSILKIA